MSYIKITSEPVKPNAKANNEKSKEEATNALQNQSSAAPPKSETSAAPLNSETSATAQQSQTSASPKTENSASAQPNQTSAPNTGTTASAPKSETSASAQQIQTSAPSKTEASASAQQIQTTSAQEEQNKQKPNDTEDSQSIHSSGHRRDHIKFKPPCCDLSQCEFKTSEESCPNLEASSRVCCRTERREPKLDLNCPICRRKIGLPVDSEPTPVSPPCRECEPRKRRHHDKNSS